MLQKTKQQMELIRKLHLTISGDLVDPLSLIHMSVKWLVKHYQRQKKKNGDQQVDAQS